MERTAWFERKFPLIEDNGRMPGIIERLISGPLRLEVLTNHLPATTLIMQPEGRWSVKEEAGHLSDLEPLWYGRLQDLQNGATELRVTDLTNQLTHQANHNNTDLTVLWQRFKERREQFVKALQQVKPEQLNSTALHPRLKIPMRIIDLAFFVAEHDDHHLASIRARIEQLS